MPRSPLTPARRARLEKLASYLEGLPADYAHFTMRTYFRSNDEDAQLRYARHNGGLGSCGAVACALGHGPAAGILFPPRLMKGVGGPLPYWNGYAALFIGGDGTELSYDELYVWLFYDDWGRYDNTHWGAAARIRYLLDHRKPPPDFCEPRERFLPLYAEYRIDAKALAS